MSEIRRFIVHPFLSVLIMSIVGLLLLAPIAIAQQYDANLYSGLRWRMVGPFRGGRVNAVSGVNGQPDTFYFGSVGGGLWKSLNSGRTWTPVFDSNNVASIGAIGVAPSNPSVIYVGTGEPDMRDSIAFGNGVYKSTDAGKTWKQTGLENTRQIGRIIIDAKNPNLVGGLRACRCDTRCLETTRGDPSSCAAGLVDKGSGLLSNRSLVTQTVSLRSFVTTTLNNLATPAN